MSWPCSLLGMWCSSTGTNRLVGRAESRLNKLEGGFHPGTLEHQCPCGQQAPQKGCPQCLCPSVCVCSCLLSPGGSLGPAGRSDPGSFQITASALGPGACEILCAPFTSGVSISHSPLVVLKVGPTDPQSFLTPWGEPVWLHFFSHLWVTYRGYVSRLHCISAPPPTVSLWLLLFCCCFSLFKLIYFNCELNIFYPLNIIACNI